MIHRKETKSIDSNLSTITTLSINCVGYFEFNTYEYKYMSCWPSRNVFVFQVISQNKSHLGMDTTRLQVQVLLLVDP